MSFFYSDLPDDTVFLGTGILRSQRDKSLGYPVQLSWLVHKHLFTLRMPWVNFSDDDINLELQDLRIQTPQGLLTSDCIDGFLKSTTPLAITPEGELPLLWNSPPSIYSLPMDTTCEWSFNPSSSLLEFSQTQPNENLVSTHIKLTKLDPELLRHLPSQLNLEDGQILFHGTGFDNESGNLHLEIPEGLGENFLDCLYLSLELLQGRAPKVVELVAHGRLEINKHATAADPDRFDLWTHHYSVSFIKELLPQLLRKLLQLPEDVFAPFRTTIKLISFGKTSQAPLEVKFLMLISALLMLSTTNDGNLQDAVTTELLGIHLPSATLIRELRNKLLHGGGSFQRAYRSRHRSFQKRTERK